MEIQVEKKADQVHILPKGNMVGENSRQVEQAVMPLVTEPGHRVLLDLSQVNRIDSNGLGILVNLTCRSNSSKGKLVYARPTMFVDEVIRVTQLNKFLVFADEL
ncbi:MAG: STAS domain-containing protein [Planctomycetota bacterium]